eukprot:PhM_4_TR12645/c0_g1_i1/m.53119
MRRLVTAKLQHPITPNDQKIFNLLLDVVRARQLDVTLRVAGGWVRNMMLGIPANDIDIAVDGRDSTGACMTGEYVANQVTLYQQSVGLESRHIGVIHSNPEKSKHLDTATTHIFGHGIDFVHLRSETYATTRIPTIQPGTIESDAERRDFTVNALYYNIHTQLVEDYCAGIQDLEDRLLRCPLDPRQTFRDDPLRLLRAIRFAFYLDLRICHNIIEASRDPEIKTAVMDKVSRERVGIEMGKTLAGPRPLAALGMLRELDLLKVVFRWGDIQKMGSAQSCELTPVEWTPEQWDIVFRCVRGVNDVIPEGEERLSAVMSALFAPFLPEAQVSPMMPSCVRFSLQLPRRVSDYAEAVLHASWRLVGMTKDLQADTTDFRELVRPTGEIPSFRTNLYDVIKSVSKWPTAFATSLIICSELLHRGPAFGLALRDAVLQDPTGLYDMGSMRPVVRGDVLAKATGVEKKQIAGAVASLLYVQVEYPGIGADDALEKVRGILSQN